MNRLYLLPIEQVANYRGPKYFAWRYDPDPPGIASPWNMMSYGFMPWALLYARDISVVDDAALLSYADVYAFPITGLNVAIPGGDALRAFCEDINVPTDWATSSTTYLELLRMLAGVFQFAQRYHGLSGQPLFGAGVTLSTRYRNLTSQQQAWFTATVESFGYPGAIINQNSTFRQMLKLAGDAWGNQPFYLGGMEF